MIDNEQLSPKTPEEALSEATAPADEETAEPIPEASEEPTTKGIDYEALSKSDLATLKEEFPALRELSSIAELDNPTRFAELRDLGLSPREAYLATASAKASRGVAYDNRSHLHSFVPKSHGRSVDTMSVSELREARELFSGMTDSEIIRLYKKVNS